MHKLSTKLLSTLHAAVIFYRSQHWNACGENFFGDHLMLERIYSSLSGLEDKLAERTVLTNGESIDVCALLTEASAACVEWSTSDISAPLIQLIEEVNECIEAGHSTGTTNLLQGISDEIEQSLYLVMAKQRVGKLVSSAATPAPESSSQALSGEDEDDVWGDESSWPDDIVDDLDNQATNNPFTVDSPEDDEEDD